MKVKVIEANGYKNEYIEHEKPKKRHTGIDFMDICMLCASIGIIVGVAFLIVGLV